MNFSDIIKWAKSKIPVSRGRYERELKLLKLSVSRSIEDEKSQLRTMINGLHWCAVFPQEGKKEIRVGMIVTDDLIRFQRNPATRDRLFFDLSQEIALKLKHDLQNHGLDR